MEIEVTDSDGYIKIYSKVISLTQSFIELLPIIYIVASLSEAVKMTTRDITMNV